MNILFDSYKKNNFLVIYSLLALVSTVVFFNAIVNIFFGICSLAIIINLILNRVTVTINKSFYFYFILLLFLIINLIFQSSYKANIKFWKFIPILSIGVLLFINIKNYPTRNFAKLSIVSCLIYVIICLIKAIIFYTDNSFLPFGNGEEIDKVLSIHRPYLGFYIIINSILLFNEILKTPFKKYKIIYSFFLFLFFCFLLLIVARLSIISFLFIVFIYLIFYIKINLRVKLITLISLVTIAFLSFYFNPKMKERFNYESIENFKDHEPRFVIWQSVFNILDNNDYNYLIGYGNYNLIEDYLVINYENLIDNNNEKRDYFIKEHFNTHSQFFDYLLLGGLPTFFLFICYNIYSLIYYRKDFVSFSIFLSFTLFMLVENIFARQLGCYLFLIYITYIYYYHKTLKL